MKLSTDFAFAGFSLVRNKPVTVLVWGLGYTLISLAFLAILIGMAGPAFNELNQLSSAGPEPDITKFLLLLSQLALPMAIGLPLAIVVGAALVTAIYRAILNPEQSSFAYLNFGMDEVRYIIVSIANAFIILAIYLIALIPFGILIAIATMIGKSLGAPLLSGILVAILVTALIVILIVAISRLTMNLVQTFDAKTIILFKGFDLTKGNVGNYLLGMIIALILTMVVTSLLFVIYIVSMGLVRGGDIVNALQAMNNQPTDLRSFLTADFLAYILFSGIVGILSQVLIIAPMAAAYKELKAYKNKPDLFA